VKHHHYKVILLQATVRLFMTKRSPLFQRLIIRKASILKVQSVVRRLLAQRLVAPLVAATPRTKACVVVQCFVRCCLAKRVLARLGVQKEINLAKQRYWRDFRDLGLTPSATKSESGREYRRLALMFHCDKHNPGKTGKTHEEAKVFFRKISEANDNLKHLWAKVYQFETILT